MLLPRVRKRGFEFKNKVQPLLNQVGDKWFSSSHSFQALFRKLNEGHHLSVIADVKPTVKGKAPAEI